VTCTDLEYSIGNLAGFEAACARFPELPALTPDAEERPVSLADALATTALHLQAAAGCPVTFSQTTASIEPGTFQVVVQYSESRSAAWRSIWRSNSSTPHAKIRRSICPTPCTACAISTKTCAWARDRARSSRRRGAGIPYRRLTQGSMVQFGWGSKQRIQAAETDRTSAVAESIAQDKELTKTLLHAAGVPVPLGRRSRRRRCLGRRAGNQRPGGGQAARRQPGQGRGRAHPHARGSDGLRSGRRDFRDVMVERYIPGHDFRLLVIGKHLVAAARRDPPQVIGDGVHRAPARRR
jgi:cyanophycin synthetase